MILVALAMLAAQAGGTQSLPADRRSADEPSDDIVVTGLRDLDDPGSAVTRGTLGSVRTGKGATASRAAFEQAEQFATCALERAAGRLALLRATLDGTINSARQNLAQTRLVQRTASCARDLNAALSGRASMSQFYDTTYYDRGALFIEAIESFTPELTLSKDQTADRAVQARFDAREVPRARFRLATDRRYFEVAVCLVRLSPELSVRLVRTRKPVNAISRIEAAIVNRGRVCVGDARRVYFDPSQFRFYIADAVYRWAVAARGVDSLIPSG